MSSENEIECPECGAPAFGQMAITTGAKMALFLECVCSVCGHSWDESLIGVEVSEKSAPKTAPSAAMFL